MTHWRFTRGLDAFLNSYGGASAYAIHKGLLGIGAEDNTVTIFPELMDSKSLFLTANADTVYYLRRRRPDERADGNRAASEGCRNSQ